jgi:hypothetical protein
VVSLRALLQQLPALLGVVVGVVTTFALTNLGERARWRRDQRVRWDTARLQAYIEYGNAVKRVVQVANRMASARGFPHSAEPVPLDQGQAELAVATADRTARWEAVLLLGHPDTVAAARAWHQRVWQLEYYALGRLTDTDGWARALDEFERTRKEFYRCARNDLGVEGAVTTRSWPPPWHAEAGDRNE